MTSTAGRRATLSSEVLCVALEDADLRVLVMSLVHLTGERRWLQAPYQPVRDVRLIADPTAGFTDEIQRELRDTMRGLLAAGVPEPVIDDPGRELLHEMMTVCLGEPVAPEYVQMMCEDMGFERSDPCWSAVPADHPPADLVAPAVVDTPTIRVLIVGAGLSGLGLGAKLGALGIDYTVVEKNPDVGGTWFENRYPRCRVDTPNHFYSYSFAPNHGWMHHFAPRDEIWRYLDRCADEFDVRRHIRFGCTVTAARWNDARRLWEVMLSTPSGEERHEAEVLVSAIGHLNQPSVPAIDGIDTFAGSVFHSARWPEALDIRGKRVAVIGTGASSMQIVPAIAKDVDVLTVYQRSPQWARPIPEYDQPVRPGLQWLLEHVPYYAIWYRFTLFWRYGDGLLRFLQKDPDWPNPERSLNRTNDRHRQELTDYLGEELSGRPDLVEKCLPTYPPYGKRMLIDNGWFGTLLEPHVELVTEAIDAIRDDGVLTVDGVNRAADVIVMATGFKITDLTARLNITGRGGRLLADEWGDDNPSAHLGVTVPGFPNLFIMYGPNTNLGHGGSLFFIAECQARYITHCLVQMIERRVDAVDCRRDVHDEYVRRIDAAHERMIWTHPGMSTWYRNRHGRVVSTMPWRLVDYWQMTHEADLADYHVDVSRAG